MRDRLLLVGCALALASGPDARAAESPNEARLREALRAAGAQVRALEEERAALQAGEAALKREIAALRAQAEAARRPVVASDGEGRKVADLKKRFDEQAESTARLKEELGKCQTSGKEALDLCRATEAERARQSAVLNRLNDRLISCQGRNEALYRVGKELADWVAGDGVVGGVAAREPFLGLRRVELENIAQDFQDKLLEQRAKP